MQGPPLAWNQASQPTASLLWKCHSNSPSPGSQPRKSNPSPAVLICTSLATASPQWQALRNPRLSTSLVLNELWVFGDAGIWAARRMTSLWASRKPEEHRLRTEDREEHCVWQKPWFNVRRCWKSKGEFETLANDRKANGEPNEGKWIVAEYQREVTTGTVSPLLGCLGNYPSSPLSQRKSWDRGNVSETLKSPFRR